jgi:hypothetical protein
MMHIEGWPPPGSFGCFPVLAANENAVWSGRHLKSGQVRLYKPGQVADHLTAADHYQLVALALDADLARQELPALGSFDPDKRLAGKEVVYADRGDGDPLRSGAPREAFFRICSAPQKLGAPESWN